MDKKLLQNVEKCDNIFLVARHLCLGLTVWLLGQAVKTSPFHGGNTGSIPVGVIDTYRIGSKVISIFCISKQYKFGPLAQLVRASGS